jgi:CheY-specific phosphatase CheX
MMKDFYEDAIFHGSNYVIRKITGNSVVKGDPAIGTDGLSGPYISVVIGISGSINGEVSFNMEEPLAFKLALKIIGDQTNSIESEIAGSCLAELGNMIMGVTSTAISKMGINTKITPPLVFTGDHMKAEPNDKMVSIPVLFNDGHVLKINTCIDSDVA